jgi:hypothetical protein
MGTKRPAADRRMGLQRRDRLNGQAGPRQHIDTAASLEVDADRRAFETERQMTDGERFGLISSLAVAVFDGGHEPRAPADVPQIATSGDGDRPWGRWCVSGDAAMSGVAPEAMLGGGCATLAWSDSEGNPRARPSSERPLPAKAA